MRTAVGPGAFDAAVMRRPGTPHVKVCGIRRVQDAQRAAELGASALGFVFWAGSPRAIAVEAAAEVARCVPRGVLRVGVFVNEFPHVVRQVAARVPLDVVQLHGDEPVEWADAFLQPVIKSVTLEGAWPEPWLTLPASRVTPLVDARDPTRRGGTGQLANWDAARALAAERPVILAGGLTPENVREAIRRVGPYAVDVSSGVEASPGVKDPERLEAFFAAMSAEAGQADDR